MQKGSHSHMTWGCEILRRLRMTGVWPAYNARERRRPARCGSMGSAAGDWGDDLVLLDLRVERGGVQHVLAVHLLGDDAPLLTGLLNDPLRLGDPLPGLLGV